MRAACLFLTLLIPATAAAHPAQPTEPSEPLELTATLTVDSEFGEQPVPIGEYEYPVEPRLGWREDGQRTANRARAPGSRGASSVRVIRACEVDLSLGDEDCAGE